MTFSRRNFLKTFTAAIVASALELRMAEPLKQPRWNPIDYKGEFRWVNIRYVKPKGCSRAAHNPPLGSGERGLG